MAVLVDEARWRWRGNLWAHMVSDESYDELHELARLIGKRRLGFQGDHYDVDSLDRDRAIAAGAVAVGSRELVRRLMASGLRRSDAKPRWKPIGASPPGTAPTATVAGLQAAGSEGGLRLVEALGQLEPTATVGHTGAWADDHRVVVLIDLAPGLALPEPGPWMDLPDEVVVGGARVGGDRSVELFAARRSGR